MLMSRSVPSSGGSWTSRLPWVNGPIGSALCFGLGIVATTAGALTNSGLGLALLASVVVAVGVSTTLPGALAGSVQCWGLYSGFLVHRFGELMLDARSVSALTSLVLAGATASVLGLSVRAMVRQCCCPAVMAAHSGGSGYPVGMHASRSSTNRGRGSPMADLSYTLLLFGGFLALALTLRALESL